MFETSINNLKPINAKENMEMLPKTYFTLNFSNFSLKINDMSFSVNGAYHITTKKIIITSIFLVVENEFFRLNTDKQIELQKRIAKEVVLKIPKEVKSNIYN